MSRLDWFGTRSQLIIGTAPFFTLSLPFTNHALYHKACMTHDPVVTDSRCAACGVILISDSTLTHSVLHVTHPTLHVICLLSLT